MTLRWPPVKPTRDRFGRYTGTENKQWNMPKSRVTTILGRIDDRYNLERWVWEKMALGLMDPERYELLREITEIGDSKSIRNAMEQIGIAGGSDEAADRGRRYHALFGAMLAGTEDEEYGPPTLEERRDLKAIIKLFEEYLIEVVDLERIVVSKELDYAGTLDYRLRIPRFDLPVVGDLKTGSSLHFSYPQYRGQMAAYTRASHEVDDDGDLIDITACDRNIGFIVHLVPGTAHAELVGSDLQAGWRTFRLAHRVWSHGRGRPRPLSFEETLVLREMQNADLDAERSRWIRARIDVLRTITATVNGLTAVKYLRSIWPEGVPLPSECIGWNGDSLGRVVGALEVTEADFIVPFGPTDPALLV